MKNNVKYLNMKKLSRMYIFSFDGVNKIIMKTKYIKVYVHKSFFIPVLNRLVTRDVK